MTDAIFLSVNLYFSFDHDVRIQNIWLFASSLKTFTVFCRKKCCILSAEKTLTSEKLEYVEEVTLNEDVLNVVKDDPAL